ncbi:MAG: helix-hairpin-helix domain-containing protein, partial [Anaerolineae bacterium]|nr:helix-hairpin-helix domain-containing protein [Anaerolineae bacterium]
MVTRIETEGETMLEPKPPWIDLNRADEAALKSLPGIGRRLAARLIAYRDEHGPFLFAEDITQVDGISPSMYEELADRLTVTIPTTGELAGQVQPSLAETFGDLADHAADTEATALGAATSGAAEPPPFIEEPEEHPLAIEASPPLLNAEEAAADDDVGWELDVEEEPAEPETSPSGAAAIPMPGPVAEEARPAAKQRGKLALFWTALLGGLLGG